MISGKNIIVFFFLSQCFFIGAKADDTKLFSIHYDTSASIKRIALIIPGKNQGASSPGYRTIGGYYCEKGMCPVYIDVRWGALGIVGVNKLSVVAKQIECMLKDAFPRSRICLFGFSFGAVISLKVAQQITADHVLLCSMSPVFVEDWEVQTFPRKQFLGMVSDFSTNGLSYSASIDKCIFFLYGDHDTHIITKAIINRRGTVFKCNETIIVKDARHDISGQSYQAAIEAIVKKISNDTTTCR